MSLTLHEILKSIPEIQLLPHPNNNFVSTEIEFKNLCTHTRNLPSKGTLFVPLGNEEVWIPKAIEIGVKGILSTPDLAIKFQTEFPEIIFLQTTNIRQVLALLASLWYPGTPSFLAAVTGSNGKTSTANLARQIWGQLGYKVASLGTLGVSVENCPEITQFANGNTTFKPVELHKSLQALNKLGVEQAVLEASSKGLLENRLGAVKFNVGVFTNFTENHLGLHGTLRNYFEAKCLLFSRIRANGVIILNNGIPTAEMAELYQLATKTKLTLWTYGKGKGDLHYKHNDDGRIVFTLFGKEYLPQIPESFQNYGFLVENILAALGIVISSNLKYEKDSTELIGTLEEIRVIPGRMELIHMQKGRNLIRIIIDSAHKPIAFERILSKTREISKRKLILVFGCIGNYERGRRLLMGASASKYTDIVIVTDDNPRVEDPAGIRKLILEGIYSEKRSAEIMIKEIGDRKLAIKIGIKVADTGDTVLILGQGQKTVVGDNGEFISLSDKDLVNAILNK